MSHGWLHPLSLGQSWSPSPEVICKTGLKISRSRPPLGAILKREISSEKENEKAVLRAPDVAKSAQQGRPRCTNVLGENAKVPFCLNYAN